MNAEFQWWLLILGIVIGGALVYLVLADVQGDGAAEEEPAEPDAGDAEAVLGPDAGGSGRARPASAVDGTDVQGDGAEPETPVADAR